MKPAQTEFLMDLRRVFRFTDDLQFQGSSGFNLSNWSMSDLLLKNPEIFKELNQASEYIPHMINHYFPPKFCLDKDLDIRKIIDRLKSIEGDLEPFFNVKNPSESECRKSFLPYCSYQIEAVLHDKFNGNDM